MARTETLDLFHTSYEALVRAGSDSLSKAYAFGGVVNALHGLFTLTQLGNEIGRTPTCVSTYKKLYVNFVNRGGERELLRVADEMGTYDVARLADTFSPSPRESFKYVPHCRSCGSFNVGKDKMAAAKAAVIAEQVKAAQNSSADATAVKFIAA